MHSTLKVLYFSDKLSDILYLVGFQKVNKKREINVDFDRGRKLTLRILYLSDLHLGRFFPKRLLEMITDQILNERYDLLVLGGDYLFLDSGMFENFVEIIKEVEPQYGKIAILGNHDRWLNGEKIVEALNKANVKVLINEEFFLKEPFNFVSFYGVDDIKYGNPKILKRSEKENNVRILLSHSPQIISFDGIKEGFDFGIFGHTHGGQIVLSKKRRILPFKDEISKKYPYGFYILDGSFSFYVSSGVGVVWLPFRLNCDPEIVFFDLTF